MECLGTKAVHQLPCRSKAHGSSSHPQSRVQSGEFDPDLEAATLLADYEAKIVALERMVGRQALEIESLKGALQQGRLPRSAPMCVMAGPAVSQSLKAAD
jgi:hypothetical protein